MGWKDGRMDGGLDCGSACWTSFVGEGWQVEGGLMGQGFKEDSQYFLRLITRAGIHYF